MSDLSEQGVATEVATRERAADRERSTETKSAYKTTEFIVYLVAAAVILLGSLTETNGQTRS